MTTSYSNKLAKVMSRAHAMRIEMGITMSEALTKSWRLYNLSKALKENISVHITYLKKDGTIREATATRNIPEGFTPSGYRRPSPKVFTYFDIEKNDYRCFSIGNLISWAI